MNEVQLFCAAGERLFGPQWQQQLSRQLCVSDRSLRRWAGGSDRIPPGVWSDLHRELQTRAIDLDYLTDLTYKLAIKNDPDLPSPPKPTEWAIEIHDPESGRHSRLHTIVVKTLADVQDEMKRFPGMIYKITVPEKATAEDWEEFRKLRSVRLFP